MPRPYRWPRYLESSSSSWRIDNDDEKTKAVMAEILDDVGGHLEVDLGHPEEGAAGEEGVRAGLVLRADPLDVQGVRNLLEGGGGLETEKRGGGGSLMGEDYLEAAFEILAALHEIFDVIDVGEIHLESVEELGLALGQVGVREQTGENNKVKHFPLKNTYNIPSYGGRQCMGLIVMELNIIQRKTVVY